MDILWIEDNNELLKAGIYELRYFDSYLSYKEIEELEKLRNKNFKLVKKYLKTTNNKIFLASNFKECIEIIENRITYFYKIIIDIEFPFENYDLSEILKDSFSGIDKTYRQFIEEISKDEYAGIIFNHILTCKYKEEFHFNKNDIFNIIVFLSGNNIRISDFEERSKINELYKKEFRYDSDAYLVRFFSKNNDKDMESFLKWIAEDKYTVILDKYTNKEALKIFLQLQKNKDCKDLTKISGNLLHLRQLLESYIIKSILLKTSEELELKTENGRSKKAFYPKGKFDENKEHEFKGIKKDILMENSKINMKPAFNNFSKKFRNLKSEEIIRLMLTYPWKILSELIHNDGSLTENGEKFIKNTNRAVNTINSLYYQLKEIILWFGDVMEQLEK